MEKLKNAGLVFCLFILLIVIFSSYLRANAAGAVLGALAGTPVLVHVFNRLAPRKSTDHPDEASRAEFMPYRERLPRQGDPDGPQRHNPEGGS